MKLKNRLDCRKLLEKNGWTYEKNYAGAKYGSYRHNENLIPPFQESWLITLARYNESEKCYLFSICPFLFDKEVA